MKNIFNKHSLLKKLIIVPAILIAGLGVNSCSDEFLNQPAYNSSDTESVFTNLETADAFVQGLYRGIVPTEMFYQLGAGDTVTHSSEDGSTNNSKYNICNYQYDLKNAEYRYGNLCCDVAVIERCNIAISRLPNNGSKHKT